MEATRIKIETLIICLAAISCVESANWFAASRRLWDPMIALGVTRLLETILILLIVMRWGRGSHSMGLGLSKIFPGFKKGVTWSAGFGILALLAFVVLFLLGNDPLKLIRTPLPAKASEIPLLLLVGGLVGPIAEEIFFRGLLYGFLRRWGVILAVVLSTCLFVIPHLGRSGLPINQVVGGVLFAIAYEVEGSLMVPITIHVLANLAIFTLSLVI